MADKIDKEGLEEAEQKAAREPSPALRDCAAQDFVAKAPVAMRFLHYGAPVAPALGTVSVWLGWCDEIAPVGLAAIMATRGTTFFRKHRACGLTSETASDADAVEAEEQAIAVQMWVKPNTSQSRS